MLISDVYGTVVYNTFIIFVKCSKIFQVNTNNFNYKNNILYNCTEL